MEDYVLVVTIFFGLRDKAMDKSSGYALMWKLF